MFVPICTMPDMSGSSVEVISSPRAHRRQRMVVTWTVGRFEESMLCRTLEPELVELEDGRSESDTEKGDELDDEGDDDEDEDDDDEVPPV
jgi:hypothetical protein